MSTNLTFTQPVLAQVLKRSAALLPSKATLAALACGHLSLVGGVPWLRTTDLEQTLTERVPCTEGSDAAGQGAWLLPIARCEAAVRTLPADRLIRLSFDDTHMTLTCGKVRARWQLLPESEYPAPAQMPADAPQLTLAAADLASALRQVQYAASEDQSRYTITGVHLAQEGTTLTCTATDGHRLARASLACSAAQSWQGIVPASSVTPLLRLAEEADGPLALAWHAQAVQATSGDTTLHLRLIDGRYPDCNGVIPHGLPVLGIGERQALLDAIRTLLAIAEEPKPAIKWTPVAEGLRLHLAGQLSDGEVELPWQWTDGVAMAPCQWGGAYLRDLVQHWPAATLAVTMRDALTPLLVTSDEAPEAQAVLMPQRRDKDDLKEEHTP